MVGPKGYPSVTEVLQPLFRETYGEINDGSKRYLDRGTFVGMAMDMLVQGKEINPAWMDWFNAHEEWVPYLAAGQKYLDEHTDVQAHCQVELMSQDLKLIGHADWLLYTPRREVVDIKTGSSEPPGWLSLQTAAYAHLCFLDDGKKWKRSILWLRPDGDYRIIEHTNPHDEADFLALLKAWWVLKGRLG